ncbi:MAG: TetR family transcriptional regulator [Pseudonocardia sp.]|nr:TetR family transcriptional regulator [Pseudonocardia sp.]
MGRTVKGARLYRSELRAEQAEGTRRRVLDAAAPLFVARGYAGTTVAAVAAAAGVSPETVYGSLGGKRGLLEGVIKAAIDGPEGVAVERQAWIAELATRPEPHDRLRGWVEASCTTLVRTSPLHAVVRGAADGEEFAVTLRARLLHQRTQQVTVLAGTLLGDALRVPVREAGERYAALVSPEMFHLLTAELGWSADRCHRWFTDILLTDLLARRLV